MDTIEESTEQSVLTHRITERPRPPATPVLNRAQRRALGRYIRHKAAVQTRHILAKRRKMMAKYTKQAEALAKQAKYAAGIVS